MRLVETEGIVLDITPYKERDNLVKVMTEKAGKQMLLVRNSMTPRSMFYQAIQPLNQVQYVLNIQEGRLGYIKAVKDIKIYKEIQVDLVKKAYAIYFGNLVNACTSDDEVDSGLYKFLKRSLLCLEENLDAEVISFIFELQLLKRFGVMPDLTKCQICGEVSEQIKYDYSQEYGGLVCQKHFGQQMKRYHADPRALYYARKFLQVHLEDLKTINLRPATKKSIRAFVDQLYDDYVGLNLKSRKFINELHNLQSILEQK